MSIVNAVLGKLPKRLLFTLIKNKNSEKIQQNATIAFILRNCFTLHVSGENFTHHQEYICFIWNQVGSYTYVVILSVLW